MFFFQLFINEKLITLLSDSFRIGVYVKFEISKKNDDVTAKWLLVQQKG